ncbi:MAG: hypothetical protein WKG07_28920 [Hymenobacter sp.]
MRTRPGQVALALALAVTIRLADVRDDRPGPAGKETMRRPDWGSPNRRRLLAGLYVLERQGSFPLQLGAFADRQRGHRAARPPARRNPLAGSRH